MEQEETGENIVSEYQQAVDRISRLGQSRELIFGSGANSTLFHYGETLSNLDRIPNEISRLTRLESLDLSGTQVSNLEPISRLRGLQRLDISRTKVTDLRPIENIKSLRHIFMDGTDVEDLLPLSGIGNLEIISIAGTKVRVLDGILSCVNLVSINAASSHLVSIEGVDGLVYLTDIDLSRAPVEDFSPIRRLHRLRSLIMDSAREFDVTVVSKALGLIKLSLSRSRLANMERFPGLPMLSDLDLTGTNVVTLDRVARCPSLTTLKIAGTRVRSLAPLSGLKLNHLDLRGTPVEDLFPVRSAFEMEESSDRSSIYMFRPQSSGLSFTGAKVADKWPFSALALLNHPQRTLETLNYLRREMGEAEVWPPNYRRPDGINQLFAPLRSQGDPGPVRGPDLESLAIRPSTHDFPFRNNKIVGLPHRERVPDEVVLRDIYGEVKRKSDIALNMFNQSNAPLRTVGSIRRLREVLGETEQDVAPGRLLMASRTVETEQRLYSNAERKEELSDEAYVALEDLVGSLSDMRSCFPQLAKLEAERLAQSILERNVETASRGLVDLIAAAGQSKIVDRTAIEALEAGQPDLAAAHEIISGPTTDEAKSEAYELRARTVGQSLLDARKFVTQTFKEFGKVAAEIGAPALAEAKVKGPNAIYAVSVAGLAYAVAGPTIALAAFASSFRPLEVYAKNVLESLRPEASNATKEGSSDK